jgi:hypothetical protein
MRRMIPITLVLAMVLLPAILASAGPAAFGPLRRQAIKAVSACRNMATVSRQLDGLAEEVGTESKAVEEGTRGRIAVIRERLEVVGGKVGELERKTAELTEYAAAMQKHAKELSEQPSPAKTPVAGAPAAKPDLPAAAPVE